MQAARPRQTLCSPLWIAPPRSRPEWWHGLSSCLSHLLLNVDQVACDVQPLGGDNLIGIDACAENICPTVGAKIDGWRSALYAPRLLRPLPELLGFPFRSHVGGISRIQKLPLIVIHCAGIRTPIGLNVAAIREIKVRE